MTTSPGMAGIHLCLGPLLESFPSYSVCSAHRAMAEPHPPTTWYRSGSSRHSWSPRERNSQPFPTYHSSSFQGQQQPLAHLRSSLRSRGALYLPLPCWPQLFSFPAHSILHLPEFLSVPKHARPSWPLGLCTRRSLCNHKPSFSAAGHAFLGDSFPDAWKSELDISVCKTPPFVHGVLSRHRFLSRGPFSMRQTWGQMPSKRKKLINALTPEGSSNTVPEKEMSKGDTPETRTSGAAAGLW